MWFLKQVFPLTCTITLLSLFSKDANSGKSPLMIWSSKREHPKTSGVYATSAIPEMQSEYRGYLMNALVVSLRFPHFISAFDCNDVKEELSLMDTGRGNLAVIDLHTQKIVARHRRITNEASAISVDWLSGNTYWTDTGHKWILCSTADLKNLKPVIRTNRIPKALALWPQKGLMFWSESSSEYFGESTILRSTLSGESSTELMTYRGSVSAMTLDYKEQRLYWIDTIAMTIYSMRITGQTPEKEVLYTNRSLSFNDLHMFHHWVYVTAPSNNLILMLNKTSGKPSHVRRTFFPTAITVTGGNAQPIQPSPCDIKNGGCQAFCFSQPPGNMRKCGCGIGMVLGPDGTSCRSEIQTSNFFLVVDSDFQWIFQMSEDGKKLTRLPLPGVDIPVQIVYDPSTTRVYWTDIGTRTVNRANLDGSNHVILAKTNVHQPIGIALDKYSRNLYWTDEGTGTINIIRTDGTHRRALIGESTRWPRGLVLDPVTGHMWWSDWGLQTIERAAMDGSNREVIVTHVSWVNGLAIDLADNKLYWCDAKQDTIERSDLDGSNREVIFNETSSKVAHFFGISVTKDYVYWSDWYQPALLRMRKNNPGSQPEKFGSSNFDKPSDIYAYVGQEQDESFNKTNPCQIGNGNCTGLCIPIPKDQTSQNDVIDNDVMAEFLTTRVCMCGRNNNGSCEKPTAKVDSIPPGFGETCPDDVTVIAPSCSSIALVNYTIPTAFDNSGKVKLELPAQSPPFNISEGNYKQHYTAVDEAGNHNTCVFILTVRVIRCPPIQEYVNQSSVKLLTSSCDRLFGSRVRLSCINGSLADVIQSVECDQDGKWVGGIACPLYPSTTERITSIEVASTAPDVNKLSSTETAKFLNNDTGLVNSISKNTSSTTSRSDFPYAIVIAFTLAISIALIAAIIYKYYRWNNISLMAALEKTLTYTRQANSPDVVVLDNSEQPSPEEQPQQSGPSTVRAETVHRKCSLPLSKQTALAVAASQVGASKSAVADYGSMS